MTSGSTGRPLGADRFRHPARPDPTEAEQREAAARTGPGPQLHAERDDLSPRTGTRGGRRRNLRRTAHPSAARLTRGRRPRSLFPSSETPVTIAVVRLLPWRRARRVPEVGPWSDHPAFAASRRHQTHRSTRSAEHPLAAEALGPSSTSGRSHAARSAAARRRRGTTTGPREAIGTAVPGTTPTADRRTQLSAPTAAHGTTPPSTRHPRGRAPPFPRIRRTPPPGDEGCPTS